MRTPTPNRVIAAPVCQDGEVRAPHNLSRHIPQVDAVLRSAALQPAVEKFGESVAARFARDALAAARTGAENGVEPPDVDALAKIAANRAMSLYESRLRAAINATGVILHTNLGRAPLGAAAISAATNAAGAVGLEMDLRAGERGARAPLAAFLAAALTGAESAMVVNNNAASLLLILAALAGGREVIVSRGELIEIGGEFRLPSIMEASGAILREVGTTNRTHARDYREALCDRTGMILSVHPSNFRVVGFATTPPLREIAQIARDGGVPLVYDTGSGLLQPDARLTGEPDATTALRDGADLICFSGDKLLGGPQAGIIAGRADLVERCRKHPIARAVRADKMVLAALEATLLAHARGERESVPVTAILDASLDAIRDRAKTIAARIPQATVADSSAVTGGGSVPGSSIPSAAIVITCAQPKLFAAALRANDPPIIARIEHDQVLLDLRTVDPNDDAVVTAALQSASTGS